MKQTRWFIPLIVAVILLIAIAAFVMGTRLHGQSTTFMASPSSLAGMASISPSITPLPASASASVSQIRPSVSPTAVSQAYYNTYVACLRKGTAFASCETNNYTADNFAQNMASLSTGSDPIVCGSGVPQSVSLGRETIMGNLATTYATVVFSGNQQKQILVNLSDETGQWRITDIACPRS